MALLELQITPRIVGPLEATPRYQLCSLIANML
jgi:hypothetical protein